MELLNSDEQAILEQERWAEMRLDWEREQMEEARDAALAHYERWVRVSALTERHLRGSNPSTILRCMRLHRRAVKEREQAYDEYWALTQEVARRG